MTATVRIALDAMGGDHGPSVAIAGAEISLDRHPEIRFLIYGREEDVRPILDCHPRLKAACTFHHTEGVVRMDEKPSQALRQGRRSSSMWRAIEAVKQGEADVVVSAGNTGALMAMSKLCLRTMAGIERPAIAGIWPTTRGESLVLDIGASIGADAEHLVDLALMGCAMARIVFDLERPTVGLLNVGVEEMKGVEAVREAAQRLRSIDIPTLDYHGFVEGDDIGRGTVDVVVTEGFSGNIALKTAEGTAKQIAEYLRAAFGRTVWSRLGFLLARGAFRALKEKMDPRRSNGGVFLGLNGVVIKSHGGTDKVGFAAAVDIGYDMVRYGLLEKIGADLARHQFGAASPLSLPAEAAES